ncbi:U-scoloptoxin(01)-Cw1a-like [Homarus americanus]|nr:U-scoloptoxin(01)-Cw1a-like [Homarus americanus]
MSQPPVLTPYVVPDFMVTSGRNNSGVCEKNIGDPDGDCVPGEALKDYPLYHVVPSTAFSCNDRSPGFYADEEAQCQVWHNCTPGGQQVSFLCPAGTIFNQRHFICDWWYSTDCTKTQDYYHLNEFFYKTYTQVHTRQDDTASNGLYVAPA